MPLDYNNPTAMVPDPSSYAIGPNNPFSLYPTMQASENNARAQPFIDTALQGAKYDLQKKAIETGEFAGPEQTEARRSKAALEGQTNAAAMAVLPFKTDKEKNEYVEDLRKKHDVTDSEMAQAQEITRNLKTGAPLSELYHRLGNLHDTMNEKDATPDSRAAQYFQTLSDFQSQYPNVQIPKDMHTVSNAGPTEPEPFENGSQIMRHIAALRASQLDSPELANKRLEILLQNQGRMQAVQAEQTGANTRTQATTESAERVAETRSAAAVAAAGMRHPVANAYTEYKKDPSDENRLQLRSHLEDQWNATATKRYSIATTLEQTSQDPKVRAQNTSYLNQKKAEYFEQYGIYLNPQTGQEMRQGQTQVVGKKTYQYKGPKYNPKDNDAWTEVK